MYKVYAINNYIVVIDLRRNEAFYGHKKEVFIDKNNIGRPIYSVHKVKDLKDGTVLEIGEIQKQNGNFYTEEEFDTFYTGNTGNFNGGGSAPSQSLITVTRAEAETLQATSSFVPGATYVITNADVNLYGGTEITLTAITSSELSLQGSGLFYCPKYDLTTGSNGYGIWTTHMEGTFSNIIGSFASGETVTAQNGATAKYLAKGFLKFISGDWSLATSISGASATADVSGFVSPSYTIGQIVHWGGKSWTNVNGNVGTSVDKYTLDSEWQVIPFNATDYNVYIDEIHYDFGNDMIIYRKDRYNNVVRGSNQVFESLDEEDIGNPIKDFQWGCGDDNFNTDDYLYIGIQGNQVIDSYCETLNFRGRYFWFNELSKQSVILYNTLSSNSRIYNNTLSNSAIYNNTLSSNSAIYNNTLSSNSAIYNNTLSSNSRISNNTLSSNSLISNNTLSSNSRIYNNTLSSNSLISNNTLSSSFISDNTLSNSKFTFSDISTNIIYCKADSFNTGGSLISLLGSTILGTNYNKLLFNNSAGVPRLQYVNNSDVIVITDVNA